MTSPPSFSVVVLAAGQGTRMRSDTHKVLHPIAGKPMLLHLLDTVAAMGASKLGALIAEAVADAAQRVLSGKWVDTAEEAVSKAATSAKKAVGLKSTPTKRKPAKRKPAARKPAARKAAAKPAASKAKPRAAAKRRAPAARRTRSATAKPAAPKS